MRSPFVQAGSKGKFQSLGRTSVRHTPSMNRGLRVHRGTFSLHRCVSFHFIASVSFHCISLHPFHFISFHCMHFIAKGVPAKNATMQRITGSAWRPSAGLASAVTVWPGLAGVGLSSLHDVRRAPPFSPHPISSDILCPYGFLLGPGAFGNRSVSSYQLGGFNSCDASVVGKSWRCVFFV